MKNKNKKLMIVVASLLVVIGVSFAYFAASNFIGGSGSSADFTTATIQGSELRVEGNIEFNDLDIYPGHENVSSIKVTATGDNELIPYNVIWEGTNTLNTSLNYTIYKTSSEIDVSASCEQQRGVIDGAMRYYEECSITNLDSLGTAIASGTIGTNQTKVTLMEDEFITSTADGISVYYYVILEYPNLEENQNSDIGGSFTGRVTIELSNAEPDINIIAAYIKQEDGSYEEVSDIPQEGYVVNDELSMCSNGAIPTGITPNITINNLSKSGTSCYLYFDTSSLDVILANKEILERSDFNSIYTEVTTATIYEETTTNGTVYYFAGNPTDNWLKFGGFYWRIIRINENGSIRMIYQGTNANTTGSGTQLYGSVFNSAYNNNAYVGYMYTVNQPHGFETSSVIKQSLDDWYQSNLQTYESYFDVDSGFCGDRTLYTRNGSSGSYTYNNVSGLGSVGNYYGAYARLYLYNANDVKPTFECPDNSDLYTTHDSKFGNRALTYPIGLISADEVVYAGGGYGEASINANNSYYLYTGQDYWTMSPYNIGSNYLGVFTVNSFGSLNNNGSDQTIITVSRGVRPVVNLKANVQLTGSGTITDPYVVVGAE